MSDLLRHAEGETVSSQNVCEQYPELLPDLEVELRKLAVIDAARRENDLPTHYQLVRCPHCHGRFDIESVAASISHINCPTCGHRFKLVGQSSQRRVGRFELIERLGVDV